MDLIFHVLLVIRDSCARTCADTPKILVTLLLWWVKLTFVISCLLTVTRSRGLIHMASPIQRFSQRRCRHKLRVHRRIQISTGIAERFFLLSP
ncbi:hypothetical protein DEU56DRAFT_843234 [Suillus clintonianus]|uniref:uncharacterized protein n=1 Tax=Suillus clintonianus TaxID=1904413 RepID=UPI001B87F578|nr:uncharacterized protein DEU56DRAFT_843234 [Suillus clintonianus]KAG2111836.1 hypothetical protein DEU56DRAFT_843234 [Suillus clintonianus]